MRVESDGHNEGNPRMFELIENAPKTGQSPTVWAFPQLVDYLKVAGQPVAGPSRDQHAGLHRRPATRSSSASSCGYIASGANRSATEGGPAAASRRRSSSSPK